MRMPALTGLVTPRLTESISEMRKQLTQVSEEAVTGRHSDLTQHLSGRVGTAMLSQKAINDITNDRLQLGLRQVRLDIAQQSLGNIQTASQEIDTSLLSAVGVGNKAAIEASALEAAAALEQTLANLNTRHGDRFLFSGDATATQPFNGSEQLMNDIRQIADTSTDADAFATALDAYFNDPAGPWQTTIYSGNATTSDPHGVVGTDPAITKLISGLATVALATPEQDHPLLSSQPEILETAAKTLADAKAGIVDLRAQRGVFQESLANQMNALELEETILTVSFNNLTAKDQYEAAAELQELEFNLEASYLMTSRLSNLSLLNFLR